MPKLEVLVGMIASGKSTYCERRGKEGAIIVNDDALLHALHGRHFYAKELRPGYKTMQVMIARTFLLMGRDVIIDSTNLKVNTRRKWLELAKEMNAEPIAVVFPTHGTMQHAHRRYMTDSRGYTQRHWEDVAFTHAKDAVGVTSSEGFAKILHQ